jgi:hypothetical protein
MSKPQLNLLMSYAYVGRSTKARGLLDAMLDGGHVRMLIDSGAFTDFSRKRKAVETGESYKPIVLSEYVAFCRTVHGRAFQYINLDVVKNAEATYSNYQTMLDAGLNPMPVFVVGEDWSRMAEYVTRNEWVCCSGGVDMPDRAIWARYKQAFAASGGKAKIHGLGFLRWPDVFKLPIRSGDSHACFNGAKYGLITIYDPLQGFVYIDRTKPDSKRAKQGWLRAVGMMRRFGINADDVLTMANWRSATGISTFLTMLAHLSFQVHARSRDFLAYVVCGGASHLYTLAATIAGWHASSFAVYRETYTRLIALNKTDWRRAADEMNAAYSKWPECKL